MSQSENSRVSLMGAISIGVGGMVGGGIFAVLGLAAVQAGGATPIAFLVAGVVALLTAYSYAKMSVTYPSRGGTVMIVDKAFGRGFLTGSVNSLLWIAYVVTLALYAVAFGNYAATFFAENSRTGLLSHLLISLGLILPTVLNLAGAELISKAETYIVALKLLLLMVVIVFGVGSVETSRLALSTWEAPLQIVSAGMMIFVAYEGFELIANTAEEIVDYKRTLPRAYYISVLFVIVIYVLIAVVVVGSLTPQKIASAEDFALAQAAKPSLGEAGFTLVAVAAVLATLSA
ncbi:MAG: amino acid permease, partial [Candidatus Eremiobacteraeota bacterium]|nr:amino acid permease [Candidatus Eremiobacteraeota bacterium]